MNILNNKTDMKKRQETVWVRFSNGKFEKYKQPLLKHLENGDCKIFDTETASPLEMEEFEMWKWITMSRSENRIIKNKICKTIEEIKKGIKKEGIKKLEDFYYDDPISHLYYDTLSELLSHFPYTPIPEYAGMMLAQELAYWKFLEGSKFDNYDTFHFIRMWKGECLQNEEDNIRRKTEEMVSLYGLCIYGGLYSLYPKQLGDLEQE